MLTIVFVAALLWVTVHLLIISVRATWGVRKDRLYGSASTHFFSFPIIDGPVLYFNPPAFDCWANLFAEK